VVGSILVEPWEEIGRRLWVEELEPLRRARIPRCQGCAHWARCLGGCRLSAAATFGAGDHPDPLAPVAAG
jgi:radical SAM protein with 4Fe4S-binding SPASM domain